ncbi:MAG: hypothetical protein BUE48_009665 [Thermomonospora sp. CIF 1]|nr:MAG: hypothetical protein BUE48_009665 [Thermomonospora sp. CIF 1]
MAAALSAALGMATAAGLIVVLRSVEGPSRPMANVDHGSSLLQEVPIPATGRPVTVTTAEGHRYTVAAVRGAVDPAPLPGVQVPPPGKGYAFIDYVLTNPQHHPILLDFPPYVFLRRSVVPPDFASRCVKRIGAPPELCDPPGRSQVIARLRGSADLIRQDADTYLAPGASYLVRAMADPPVPDSADHRDMGLFIWEVRFTGDRRSRHAPFPGEDSRTG